LMRYGFVDEAVRLIMGLFEAAEFQGHRLPELFGGLARDDVPFPVPYPSSCSPQAWSAASPLLCLRTMLRLDPWLPHGKVWLNPVLPPGIDYLRVERIPLAGRGVTVEVADGRTKVEGLPPEVELIEAPPHPLTAAGRGIRKSSSRALSCTAPLGSVTGHSLGGGHRHEESSALERGRAR